MTANKEKTEHSPESFMDIARICVKKQQKGLFDQLITSVYRIKKLVDYYPCLEQSISNEKKLLLLISKGLQFKSFKEFKTEMQQSESLSYLKDINNLNVFYEYLSNFAVEHNLSLEKAFLIQIQNSIRDNTNALNFLQNFLNTQINTEEEKLEKLPSLNFR